jgi:cysteinyl-tRNA synthetase
MTLTLYNTLTRKKEPFRPIDPANVRMYVCGPTVYDFAHIGNARPVIVFDVLFRLLRYLAAKGEWDGGKGQTKVTYVRNITDVDDKINARAAEEGVPIRELTERTLKQFHEDVAALGVLPPTVEPRATDYIRRSDNQLDMVRLIETLVQRGHAYVADDHVLFDVASMPDYGRFANRSLDEMEAGARVEVAPYKKGPMDFVLWKPSKAGEPAWPSPAGIKTPGRPGWHIECSAMAGALLGETFDIHGGGIDLVFPHHENEIAQSRCAHGTPVMANVWMHNGFLQVEGEKMSKSLGNFVTINELLTGWNGYRWPGAVIRFAMLTAHYRQPMSWTQQRLEEAAIALETFKAFSFDDDGFTPPSSGVVDALKDDLNTPQVIAELHRLLSESKKSPIQMQDHSAAATLRASCKFLGLNLDEVDLNQMSMRATSIDRAKVSRLIAARNAARKTRNFKEADRIREELTAMGLQLKDAKDPATGEIVTTWEVRAPGTTEAKR